MHGMDDNFVSWFESVEELRDLAFQLMIEYGKIQDLNLDERIYALEGWKRRQYQFKRLTQLKMAE